MKNWLKLVEFSLAMANTPNARNLGFEPLPNTPSSKFNKLGYKSILAL
jgi:hypothetical protein